MSCRHTANLAALHALECSQNLTCCEEVSCADAHLLPVVFRICTDGCATNQQVWPEPRQMTRIAGSLVLVAAGLSSDARIHVC